MTVNQLINKAAHISRQLTSGSIPLTIDGIEVDIDFSLGKNTGGLYVAMDIKEEEKDDTNSFYSSIVHKIIRNSKQ